MEILTHLSLKCFSSPCVLNTQENKFLQSGAQGPAPTDWDWWTQLDARSAGPPVLWPLDAGLSRHRATSLLPSLGLACGSGQTSLPRSPLREKQLMKEPERHPPLSWSRGQRACWGGMCCIGRDGVSHQIFLSPQEFLLKIFCVFRNLMKMSVFPRDWMVMRLLTSKWVWKGPAPASTQLSPHYYMWEKKRDGNLSRSKLWGQRGEGLNVKVFGSAVSRTLPFTKVQGGEIVKDSSKVESKVPGRWCHAKGRKGTFMNVTVIPEEGSCLRRAWSLASVALRFQAASLALLLIWFVLSARHCSSPTASANYPPKT